MKSLLLFACIPNLKKRFAFLSHGKDSEKQKLKVTNLPFSEYICDFEEDYEKIIKSDFLGDTVKNIEKNGQ